MRSYLLNTKHWSILIAIAVLVIVCINQLWPKQVSKYVLSANQYNYTIWNSRGMKIALPEECMTVNGIFDSWKHEPYIYIERQIRLGWQAIVFVKPSLPVSDEPTVQSIDYYIFHRAEKRFCRLQLSRDDVFEAFLVPTPDWLWDSYDTDVFVRFGDLHRSVGSTHLRRVGKLKHPTRPRQQGVATGSRSFNQE